jgi:release factor glutamine methyltransferase
VSVILRTLVRVPALPGAEPPKTSEHRLRAALDVIAFSARPVVVEVGAGAGALACAVAAARVDALVYATDESEFAIRHARRNQRHLGLRNLHVRAGSLLEPLPQCLYDGVDVVVSSLPFAPPCLAKAGSLLLPAGSPCGSGEDGLKLLRTLAIGARAFLVRGGSLVFQVASFQWFGFAQELSDLGYEDAVVVRRAENIITARALWS